MTVVDAYEHYGSFDFETKEAAKAYVAEHYKRQWGENAIVLFRMTSSGLMLEVEDRIYIIREDD